MNTDYRSSHTPEEIRNLWQTPNWLFNVINKRKDFVCDIAASKTNHLVRNYLSEERSAFNFDFEEFRGRYVWCNPPYSDISPWVDLAIRNQQNHGVGTVLLIPADTSVGWFDKCRTYANSIMFITGGRVSFVRADTGLPVSGNTKGSMLVIFEPTSTSNPINTYYIDRDSLKTEGTE